MVSKYCNFSSYS